MRRLHLAKEKADLARQLLRVSVNESQELRFVHRLHCVVLVAEGHTCAEIARWFGGSPRTIERWVHSFEERGVEGIRDDRQRGGRPSKLPVVHLRGLTADLSRPPIVFGYPDRQWSGRLVALHVARRFGVTLQPRQCQRILREVRASSATNVPSPTPSDA